MKIHKNEWTCWRRALTALLAGMATTVIVACGEDSTSTTPSQGADTQSAKTNGQMVTDESGVIDLLFIGHGQREGKGYHQIGRASCRERV